MELYPTIKRCMDVLLSLIGLIILSPVFVLIAILIKFDTKGPVFFRQKRVGKQKKHFYILKFRTMSMDSPNDMPTHMLQGPDKFITKLGKFLRKTSLDELPQMINILKGEMSIVGPRPALWNQYDLVAKRDEYGVNDVVSGLTGWAQVNGRDEIPLDKKVEYDREYVENMSFSFDMKVLIKTFFNVIRSEGVVEGGKGEVLKQRSIIYPNKGK